jgi:hypothetical protein
LAAALAHLAIHQDVQQEAYEQIISIAGQTADPVLIAHNAHPDSVNPSYRDLKITIN